MRSLVWAYQGGMFVRAPLVEAKQDGSIRIHDLTEVVMARRCLGLAEARLVPFETAGYIPYADDCPSAFHRISALGLRLNGLQVIEKIGEASRGSKRRPHRCEPCNPPSSSHRLDSPSATRSVSSGGCWSCLQSSARAYSRYGQIRAKSTELQRSVWHLNRNSPFFGFLDEQGAAPLLQVLALSRTLYLGLLQAAAGILRIISRR
jgi:hypothetical protein